jgi:hypothetical protein
MTALKRLVPLALVLLAGAGPVEPGHGTAPRRHQAHQTKNTTQAHRKAPPRPAKQAATELTNPAPARRDPDSAFTPAPLPNDAMTAPISPVESRTHAEPTLFDLTREYRGDGYVYGSSPQGRDDRRSAHVPGVELKVPLR